MNGLRFFLLSFLLSGCFETTPSPESALQEFVESRLSKVASKAEVLARCTGKMRMSIEAMNDEAFGSLLRFNSGIWGVFLLALIFAKSK